MNNGVETNQNNSMDQPVLTPVADNTAPTIVSTETPTIVSSDAVATPTVAAAPEVPATPTPVVVAPTIDPLASTDVAQPAAPVEPTVAPPTPVMLSPTDVSTTVDGGPVMVAPPDVVPTDNTSMELPSMKVDERIEKKKKKKKGKEVKDVPKEEVVQKKSSFPTILFFVILLMGVYIFYSNNNYKNSLAELKYKCSPVNETREEKQLDLNSTLVQDLYHKVATSIREDVAQPEWNKTMELYLAFRQLSENEMYDSNCNMFSKGKMEPYTCEVSTNFVPKSFKTSTLELEWKKLFGEERKMPLINVKLENSCIGGYEYIAERDEYVQGYCKQPTATSYRVKKELKEAISSRNTIVLVEEVTYAGNEKMELPSYLKSGTYYYTFRLDMNYNYVLLAKTYNEKY